MSGLIPTSSNMTNPWIAPQRSSAIWSGEPSSSPASVQRATLPTSPSNASCASSWLASDGSNPGTAPPNITM